MKRNRRIKKHSRFKSGATGMVSLIVSSFIMLMIYWTLDSQCTLILREIGKDESRMKALEAEYGRETARWSGMNTRERLDEKITRIGLAMQSPHPDQIVRMLPNGKPAPGQMSIARAKSKSKLTNMALATPRNPRRAVRR